MTTPLLEVKDLSVAFRTYGGTVKAVRNVSFHINKGETVGIVGESGCGKSATAQAVIRLIPSPPGMIENGEILFEGIDLLKKTSKEMERIRGKEVSMIFQDPMSSLNPTMKIGRQIFEILQKHLKFSKRQAQARSIELMHEVGISDPEKRLNQYPHEFSGGMRQRAMIALALACNPKLLIADEPTTALDVTIQAQILNLMKDIQQKKQMSIVLITHDLGIVAGMCDRVLVMYGGTLVEVSEVNELYASPFHPYTKGLLKSVPRLDMDKKRELVPIKGTPPHLLHPPKGCPFIARCPYAMLICNQEFPPISTLSDSHQAACWLKQKQDQA